MAEAEREERAERVADDEVGGQRRLVGGRREAGDRVPVGERAVDEREPGRGVVELDVAGPGGHAREHDGGRVGGEGDHRRGERAGRPVRTRAGGEQAGDGEHADRGHGEAGGGRRAREQVKHGDGEGHAARHAHGRRERAPGRQGDEPTAPQSDHCQQDGVGEPADEQVHWGGRAYGLRLDTRAVARAATFRGDDHRTGRGDRGGPAAASQVPGSGGSGRGGTERARAGRLRRRSEGLAYLELHDTPAKIPTHATSDLGILAYLLQVE